jgi:hypothetical protein
MVNDRIVQPRQIYASTMTRRERRWTSRRGRSRGRAAFSWALMSAVTIGAALSVLGIVVPGAG